MYIFTLILNPKKVVINFAVLQAPLYQRGFQLDITTKLGVKYPY